MAFKLVESVHSKAPTWSLPLDGSTAVTAGAVYYNDYANAVLKAVTSAAGKTINQIFLATETKASGATSVKVKPLFHGDVVVADCTNTTAANQILVRQVMTDLNTVNNSSSDTATNLAIFLPIGTVGPASQKQLLGYFLTLGQQTA